MARDECTLWHRRGHCRNGVSVSLAVRVLLLIPGPFPHGAANWEKALQGGYGHHLTRPRPRLSPSTLEHRLTARKKGSPSSAQLSRGRDFLVRTSLLLPCHNVRGAWLLLAGERDWPGGTTRRRKKRLDWIEVVDLHPQVLFQLATFLTGGERLYKGDRGGGGSAPGSNLQARLDEQVERALSEVVVVVAAVRCVAPQVEVPPKQKGDYTTLLHTMQKSFFLWSPQAREEGNLNVAQPEAQCVS